MGWLIPIILRAKDLLQQLWIIGVIYDDKLPSQFHIYDFKPFMKNFYLLRKFKYIIRYLFIIIRLKFTALMMSQRSVRCL